MLTKAFPIEMRLVADALRQIRQQIAFLVHAGDDRVAGHTETQTILADGLDVADALERLAELLAEAKQPNGAEQRIFSQQTPTEIEHDHQNQDPT